MINFNRIALQLDSLSSLDSNTNSHNAPVTRVSWSCNSLPNGLTLSSSGLLTGHPTVTGIFDCNFSVSTNWGTANKTIRIVINDE